LEDRNLISLAENLPDPGDEYFLVRKRDRLLNDMARQMERQDLAKEALAYYKKSSIPLPGNVGYVFILTGKSTKPVTN
jgi:hypothetical protein